MDVESRVVSTVKSGGLCVSPPRLVTERFHFVRVRGRLACEIAHDAWRMPGWRARLREGDTPIYIAAVDARLRIGPVALSRTR